MIRNNKGMTLLEIMIVLVILGGLIGILATQVQKQLMKANVKNAKIQIAEYGKALDYYYQDCNSYPSTEEGLEALMKAPASCPNWGPDPYLKSLNKDPWGSPLVYEQSGSGYILKSYGADKKEGGTGLNADITNE